MAEIEVTGIRKDHGNHQNPHEAATHYRWVEHSSNKSDITLRQTVVGWLENSINGERITAYVNRVSPRVACYVNKSAVGTKFLETTADSTSQNNLLNLPEC